MNPDEIIQIAKALPSMTQVSERKLLIGLAREVKPGGTILELGCLYGGMTAVLALANPLAQVISIDNFSWYPKGYALPSPETVREGLDKLGIKNVTILNQDTTKVLYAMPSDLLWIDGGHEYKTAKSDLHGFGLQASVIAMHDYTGTNCPEVTRALNDWLLEHQEWYMESVTHSTALLRRFDVT